MSFRVKEYVIDYILCSIGCVLYAIGITAFVQPNPIAPGGATGIAMVINEFFNFLPVGTLIIFINIPLVVAGFLKFKLGFVVKTAFSVLFSSVLIDVFMAFLPYYDGDIILSALAGGVITGVGLALIMVRGATTGGTDIIAKLINRKYRYLSVGRLMLYVDAMIVVLSAFVDHNFETVLYSVLYIFTLSVVMDKMIYGADHGKLLYIITSYPDSLIKEIISDVGRGVTKLQARGGYTDSERTMLMCTLRATEVSKTLSIVRHNDENAFVIVTDAGEILGEGFKKFDL